jgi:hypothetical protein
MSFIRTKKRILKDKTTYYAYLVKNKWDKKKNSPRQSVSKYLGKIIEPENIKDISFEEYLNINTIKEYAKDKTKEEIIDDLVLWEIEKNNRKITYKKTDKTLIYEKKEIVLKINEGFLTRYTIQKLIKFKTKEEDPHMIGLELATAFTLSGIKVPKDIFVIIFEKIGKGIY